MTWRTLLPHFLVAQKWLTASWMIGMFHKISAQKLAASLLTSIAWCELPRLNGKSSNFTISLNFPTSHKRASGPIIIITNQKKHMKTCIYIQIQRVVLGCPTATNLQHPQKHRHLLLWRVELKMCQGLLARCEINGRSCWVKLLPLLGYWKSRTRWWLSFNPCAKYARQNGLHVINHGDRLRPLRIGLGCSHSKLAELHGIFSWGWYPNHVQVPGFFPPSTQDEFQWQMIGYQDSTPSISPGSILMVFTRTVGDFHGLC